MRVEQCQREGCAESVTAQGLTRLDQLWGLIKRLLPLRFYFFTKADLRRAIKTNQKVLSVVTLSPHRFFLNALTIYFSIPYEYDGVIVVVRCKCEMSLFAFDV